VCLYSECLSILILTWAQSGECYTINFYDSGNFGQSSNDSRGIRIVYTPVAPQPRALPNSTPQPLKRAISGYRRR
jgi:hypothetical protein